MLVTLPSRARMGEDRHLGVPPCRWRWVTCCGFPFPMQTPGRRGREGASIALLKQGKQQGGVLRSEKTPHGPLLIQLPVTPGLEAEAPASGTVTSPPC